MTIRPGPGLRVAAAGLVAGLLAGCSDGGSSDVSRVRGGNPAAGRSIVAAIGCGACHEIPGIPGADGIVGPSLAGFARRPLIAGSLPNRAEELVAWVDDAPRLAPDTAMPDMPLGEAEARHVAAYLLSLR
jgi:cytochrome c1